jgi:TRAP-type transport system periplasmic protein
MNKVFKLVVVSLMIIVIGESISSAEGQTLVLRLGQPQSLEHPQSLMVDRIAEKIKILTTGEIILKHYPAGQLGSQPEMFRQMVDGGLDFVIGGTDQAGQYHDPVNVFEMTYLYKSPEHMVKVLTSSLAKSLYEEVRKKSGVIILNPVYFGTRILSTKNVKVTKPEQLKGIKIRSVTSPIWVDNMSALGCTPVPMPLSDVYMALQTGTVEGQDNPLPGVKSTKFYEVQNNFILTNHFVGFSVVCVNEKAWNRIPSKYRDKIAKVFLEEADWMANEITKQEVSIRKELEAMGKVFIEPDREAFREARMNYDKEKTKKRFGDLVDKISKIN